MKQAILILTLVGWILLTVLRSLLRDGLLSKTGRIFQSSTRGETSGFFGQGYDYAYSSAASSVELGCFLENEVIDTASGYSFMELFLQGLSNLEGVIGANNSITVDFSQTEMDAVNYLNFTSLLSVMAGLVVSGMAD